jgi:hypothetical protein
VWTFAVRTKKLQMAWTVLVAALVRGVYGLDGESDMNNLPGSAGVSPASGSVPTANGQSATWFEGERVNTLLLMGVSIVEGEACLAFYVWLL